MPYCSKCGTEISDYQYENFKGMCSQCIRITSYSSKESGKSMIGFGFVMVFVSIMFMFGGIMGIATNQPGLVVLLIIGILLFFIGIFLVHSGYKKTKSL